MKNLFALAILLSSISTLGADLNINVTPNRPIIIPVAQPAFPTPYFIIDRIAAIWSGKGPLYVHKVTLKTEGTDQVNCVIKDAPLARIFSETANRSGLIFIVENQAFRSSSFVCDGVKIPAVRNPFATYNIPVHVKVWGVAALTGTEVIGQADIVLQ